MDAARSSERTEREKALAGDLYDSTDPELVEMKRRSRRLQRKFNQSTELEEDLRQEVLQEWLGFKGQNLVIEPPFTCDYGTNVYTGDNTYMNFDCTILDTCRVDIGSRVMGGPKIQIYTATHPLDAAERSKGPEAGRPIKIGNDVWLGGGCIICPGVTIGDNSTVGAGAVVTKDIPPNVVVAGNPARVIRELAPPPA